jgi:hypothetical protein
MSLRTTPARVVLLVAAVAIGCSGEERAVVQAASDALEPVGEVATAAQAQASVMALPARPARLFEPQSNPVGPEFAALRARIDPGDPSDAWPTEVVAEQSERALEQGFTALLAGDDAPLMQRVGRRVVLEGRLRPLALDTTAPNPEALTPSSALGSNAELQVLRDDTCARVVRATGPDATRGGVAELRAEFERLTRPLRSGTRARARVEVLESGTETIGESADSSERVRPTTKVRVRLAADLGASAMQVNLVLDVAWRVAEGGARIVRVTTRSYEEVRLARRAFVDATEHALAAAPTAHAALAEDALALTGRVDNVVPPSLVALGMHGCAVGDVDGDGYEDLYVGRVAGSPNLLLMNGAGGVAREEAQLRGVDFLDDTGGVLIVDLDGDGARDLAMGRGGDVLVAWNDGRGHFTARSTLRLDDGARVHSLAAGDIDGDGDLDLYDTRYFRVGGYGDQAPTPYHDATNGAPNRLWRNLLEVAPRTFRDDTHAVGLDVDNDRFSLAAVFEDFDADGDLDLYVANDFGRNNLFDNQGARFVDVAARVGLDDRAAGMGLSLADVDLDGRFDVLVSNMWAPAGARVVGDPRFQPGASSAVRASYARHARGNSLFRGRVDGTFEDVTERSGAGPAGWCWGARFVDWDRDGFVDIVAPNGFLTGRSGPDLTGFFWRVIVGRSPGAPPATNDYLAAWAAITKVAQEELVHWNGREPTYGYLNLGGFDFVDVSAAAGLDVREDGRALAVCDWDRDGRLDLWTRNRSAPALRLMRGNAAPEANWIAFELRGRAPNTDAVGALVEVDAGGVTRRQRVRAGEGFLAGSSLRAHFGLGAHTALDAVRVCWSDGRVDTVEGARVGALWRIVQPEAADAESPGPLPASHLFGSAASMVAAAAPLPDEPSPPRTRVPLLDTFPLGAARLVPFGAAPVRIDELAGPGGLAVLVWHSGVAESRTAVAALAARRSELEASGLAVFTLALDEAREAAAAEAWVTGLGLRARAGRSDRATRLFLDMVLGRTLAPFDDVPLPLVLLFDPRGELGLLQVGALDLDGLAHDAATLAARPEGPEGRWATGLTGGQWEGHRPRRSLRSLARRLRDVGLPELADGLESAAQRRQEP